MGTHAITFHKKSQKIINHVVQDTETTHGIEISKTTSAPYPERKDSQGNIIPFILPPYAKLKEQIYSTTKIKQQEQQRQIWQEEIDHLFNRNDVRLLWNIKKENYIHNQKNYPQTLSSSSSSSSSLSSSDSIIITTITNANIIITITITIINNTATNFPNTINIIVIVIVIFIVIVIDIVIV